MSGCACCGGWTPPLPSPMLRSGAEVAAPTCSAHRSGFTLYKPTHSLKRTDHRGRHRAFPPLGSRSTRHNFPPVSSGDLIFVICYFGRFVISVDDGVLLHLVSRLSVCHRNPQPAATSHSPPCSTLFMSRGGKNCCCGSLAYTPTSKWNFDRKEPEWNQTESSCAGTVMWIIRRSEEHQII